MKDNTLGAYNIADLRELARHRLPKAIFFSSIAAPGMTCRYATMAQHSSASSSNNRRSKPWTAE
jgi:hypothetical protein